MLNMSLKTSAYAAMTRLLYFSTAMTLLMGILSLLYILNYIGFSFATMLIDDLGFDKDPNGVYFMLGFLALSLMFFFIAKFGRIILWTAPLE